MQEEQIEHEQESDPIVNARREFLARCGRLAVVTPPVVTLMLAASQRNFAVAQSGGGGDPGEHHHHPNRPRHHHHHRPHWNNFFGKGGRPRHDD